ncbi:XRE family transcriptional regulator [Psychrobacillus lasiicapitis]|uniref:XRE family transcriptional regulator n=1 Tax=Psychrobacillus lasiicapitis TaxID=1636719 RepID=A0A544TAH3_9BACI|nr:XRE family transcriptional regulator [Psychrobacillus lasiicapitis]TQR14358.1 XRE family transcriptional regulator [Psychrobacillus lasiicapitis]GGA32038.1 hypothetical protein GCM10011384_22020 [Psychrobacillus lasiicapitis]
MYLNKGILEKYMKDNYDGSYRKFARDLQVEPAQLHRILNSEAQAGVVFLGRLHNFCKSKNIDYNQFIFFEESVNNS